MQNQQNNQDSGIPLSQEELTDLLINKPNTIRTLLIDPDVEDSMKYDLRISSLGVAAENILKVARLLRVTLPENNDIPKILLKMADTMAFAAKRILESSTPEENEYKIPEKDLEELMKILDTVDVKLPEELK